MIKNELKFINGLGCTILKLFDYIKETFQTLNGSTFLTKKRLTEINDNLNSEIFDEVFVTDNNDSAVGTQFMDLVLDLFFAYESTHLKRINNEENYVLPTLNAFNIKRFTDAFQNLINEINSYARLVNLDEKGFYNLQTDKEVYAFLVLKSVNSLLGIMTFQSNKASTLEQDVNYNYIQLQEYLSLLKESNSNSLVKNSQGQVYSYFNEIENVKIRKIVVYKKSNQLEGFNNIPTEKDDSDSHFVIVDEKHVELCLEKEQSTKKLVKEFLKNNNNQPQTKVKKAQPKRIKKEREFNKSFNFGDFSFLDAVLTIVPTIIAIVYLILAVTGAIKDIHFFFSFDFNFFGYDFELYNLAMTWFENTEHGFFSAITLGLLQIILMILGFLVDLIVYLILIIIGILWILLATVLSFCFYYVFSAAIVIWLIIYFFKVEKSHKGIVLISFLVSLTCSAVYYITIFSSMA